MESTNKLRWRIKNGTLSLADEIEREIAERYMELPVDADGVPINPDDVLEWPMDSDGTIYRMTVQCVRWDGAAWTVEDECGVYDAELCRHVKPRTIEDVLEEFLIEFDDWDWNTGGNDRDNARKQLFAKYAEELRNMGVGE